MKAAELHTFHIPVMGLAFTIDSPIRVAQYGISSVISIADDDLIEKMNSFYSKKFQLPYKEITQKVADYRAKRITSYLNLVDKIVTINFEKFKSELIKNKELLDSFLEMLPTTSDLKNRIQEFFAEKGNDQKSKEEFVAKHLAKGAIDVNIMTKLDKDNFIKGKQLPVEFNDAHSALRGFAQSDLQSSVVLSAGMNPRLFSYFENFEDFYPSNEFGLKKKIILKVSDFRSALIQGSFLAKKGLWVSEYRVESGLNCGGHAFATNGYLVGPILNEFKQKRKELENSTFELLCKSLEAKGRYVPENLAPIKITMQGGVGTAEEHTFLLDHCQVDSVGWGTPFLLCPEATSVDLETRNLLAAAKEEDLYLSNISPLGVPFNTIKGMTNEAFKNHRISQNKAGSSCPKKYLALSKEMGAEGVCTASKKFQDKRLKELEEQRPSLSDNAYQSLKNTITEKSCLCVGLANSSYLENDLPIKGQAQGVVICPGPNMAYFDKEVSLKEMVGHIYGRNSVLADLERPLFFMKELQMYIQYFKKELESLDLNANLKELKKLQSFKENLLDGISYYESLLDSTLFFASEKEKTKTELGNCKVQVMAMSENFLETAQT